MYESSSSADQMELLRRSGAVIQPSRGVEGHEMVVDEYYLCYVGGVLLVLLLRFGGCRSPAVVWPGEQERSPEG